MKKLLTALMTATLCLMMALPAAAVAPQNEFYQFHVEANQEQLEIINQIQDRDISTLEYLELVYPEVAVSLSTEQRQSYASVPFDAGDSVKPMRVANGQVAATCKASGTSVTYSATASAFYTPTKIILTASLVDSSGKVVASATKTDYGSSLVNAGSTKSGLAAGTYQCKGAGTFTFVDFSGTYSYSGTSSSVKIV